MMVLDTSPPVPLPDAGAPAPAPLLRLPADQHPAAVYLGELSPGSRPTMRQSLTAVAKILGYPDARSCPWHQIRFQHTAMIRSELAAAYAPATANKMLAALKGVLLAARRLGQLDANDYLAAVDLRPVRGSTEPAGRALTQDELRKMLLRALHGGDARGARDAAIVALLYTTGLRRSELVALDVADVDRADDEDPERKLFVRVLHGKGNKARTVPLRADVSHLVGAWLAWRGEDRGPLFCPLTKWGTVRRKRLTPQGVFGLVNRRAVESQVPPLSPHDFRRTFITDLLDKGVDLAITQDLAGHANMATTKKYDRRGAEAQRHAVELLTLPVATGDIPPYSSGQTTSIR